MEVAKARVLVVEHNLILRKGLCDLVEREPDMDLVGATTSARDAVRLFSESRPGVVLMDLDLPNSAGIHSVREIRDLDPAACIIGLFTYPWDDSGNLARDAGAQTCVAKDRLHQDLVEVIRSCWHKHLGEL